MPEKKTKKKQPEILTQLQTHRNPPTVFLYTRKPKLTAQSAIRRS